MDGLGNSDQRYYASTYGRFNSPDPYAASGGPNAPGSWNRYSYTRGDPINSHDPHGLQDCNPFISPEDCCLPSENAFGAAPLDDPGCMDPGPGGPGPDPGPTPPQPPAPPPPSCEQQLTNTIAGALAGTPLAGEASDFVDDAEFGGLNPLLIVAIAGAESSYGSRIAPGSNNPFGLLHGVKVKGGKTRYVPINYCDWNDAINAAVSTVDKQFINGNVTVSELYSGLPGAYCVGPACSNGAANVASIFQC